MGVHGNRASNSFALLSGVAFRSVRGSSIAVGRHPGTNLGQGRKNAEEREGASIHNHRVVDADPERSVRPCLKRHVDTEVPPKHSCRPGSLNGGHSVDAALDRDLRHEIGMDAGDRPRRTRTFNSGDMRRGRKKLSS